MASAKDGRKRRVNTVTGITYRARGGGGGRGHHSLVAAGSPSLQNRAFATRSGGGVDGTQAREHPAAGAGEVAFDGGGRATERGGHLEDLQPVDEAEQECRAI